MRITFYCKYNRNRSLRRKWIDVLACPQVQNQDSTTVQRTRLEVWGCEEVCGDEVISFRKSGERKSQGCEHEAWSGRAPMLVPALILTSWILSGYNCFLPSIPCPHLSHFFSLPFLPSTTKLVKWGKMGMNLSKVELEIKHKIWWDFRTLFSCVCAWGSEKNNCKREARSCLFFFLL